MKCPKCGYVSFEYLEECKKCGKSLGTFKSEHGLYGYQPKDLMILDYLENKTKTEEEDDDENLENIISEIEDVGKGSETVEEPIEGISLDLEEPDTAGDEAEEVSVDLEESLPEKETGEIELTLDDTEVEEKEVSAPIEEKSEAEEPAEEIAIDLETVETSGGEAEESLDLGEPEEPLPEKETGEIELNLDEVEIGETEVPASASTGESDLGDEITLELDDLGEDLEIDDLIKEKEPPPAKKNEKESDDELKLELE